MTSTSNYFVERGGLAGRMSIASQSLNSLLSLSGIKLPRRILRRCGFSGELASNVQMQTRSYLIQIFPKAPKVPKALNLLIIVP